MNKLTLTALFLSLGFLLTATHSVSAKEPVALKMEIEVDDDSADKKSAKKTLTPQKQTPTEGSISKNLSSISNGLKCKIDGKEIQYSLQSGTLPIQIGSDKPQASMFYLAYTREDVADDIDSRPITFCINGGPGSSSVWLHLGGMSPTRIQISPDKKNRKPFVLKANEYSILDKTDLVFIDPISTGFSTGKTTKDAKTFHAFDKDLTSIAEFIRLYITRTKRWGSPKYICGESYGGLRAAALPHELQKKYHLELDGVILVSGLLDFQTLISSETNDLPYIAMFPSFCATSFHHNQLQGERQDDLQKTLKEAKRFASGLYATGLLKGDELPQKMRKRIIKKYAELTGLSEEYIDKEDLRISTAEFAAELLRDERKTLGRFDGRFTSLVRDANAQRYSFDASASKLFGQFSAAQKSFLSNLGIKNDEPYEILTSKVHPWSYKGFENKYVNVAGKLRSALLQNERLRVLACCGYTDLATPYFGMEYSINHLRLPPEIRKEQIEFSYYSAGHMMYVDDADMKKWKRDLDRFFEKVKE